MPQDSQEQFQQFFLQLQVRGAPLMHKMLAVELGRLPCKYHSKRGTELMVMGPSDLGSENPRHKWERGTSFQQHRGTKTRLDSRA